MLLDDPLSALDHQTAEIIVRKCLDGPLMEARTVILVTHRTELCRDLASQTIEISDGVACVLDPETVASNKLSKVKSYESADTTQKQAEDQEKAVPDKFIADEKREHGGVRFPVYWQYIQAGKLFWWAILICALAIRRFVDVGETWFLKSWGESYSRPSEESASGLFDTLPSPEINIRPWLVGFFVFAATQSVMYFVTECLMLVIIYFAGRSMFKGIIERVSHATFRFYDVTPIGRLMNRMTSDIGTVDGNISSRFSSVVWLAIKWITSVVIIASVTPVFLAVAIALTPSFVLIFRRFLPTSQSLRRLEVYATLPIPASVPNTNHVCNRWYL